MEELITFEDLGLNEQTLAAVEAKGFEMPSPIQVLAIPRLLTGDANLIAKARTGTGKTAAFGIPLLQKITHDKGSVQALVLTPTRELALQVCKEIESLSSSHFPRLTAVYGGQSMGEQLRKLRSGVEIVVGTPGRIKDHLDRKSLKLDNIDYFILDEADEMLDMGFFDDIEAIFRHANPSSRILLFSATMPNEILKIASKFMGEYEIIEEEERPEEPILTEQKYWVVRENEKIHALVRLIDLSPEFYGLIFTQTKADADIAAKELDERGYQAAALHGDIPQSQREKILARFRKKKTKILVATDVAARGIDIEGLTHVVNYAMPFDAPTYVHRIGRTGRAGAKGLAFTFVRPEERRRIGYLCNVSKGNLKEAPVPSVEEVLKIRRERLFDDTLKIVDSKISMNEQSDTFSDDATDFAEKSGSVKKPQKVFIKLAEKLCENHNPQDVLAAVLEENYAYELDIEKYGTISSFKQGANVPAGGNKQQTRLYVGLGRRDGYGRSEIAQFFTKLLHIPGRLVDRIELTESFSLVSLPTDIASQALDLCTQNKSLPHMHIDAKNNEMSYGRNQRSFSNSRDDSRRGKRTPKSNLMPMQHKTGNASLYRKTEKSTKKGNKKTQDM